MPANSKEAPLHGTMLDTHGAQMKDRDRTFVEMCRDFVRLNLFNVALGGRRVQVTAAIVTRG